MGKTILTPKQQQTLGFLAQQPDFGHFYLSGGTALAEYYLQHRLSEDLDFFSENEIDVQWLPILAKAIKEAAKADSFDMQQSFNRNLIYFTFGGEVLKTEFTYYPFLQLEKPMLKDGIRIDSLKDIAINKLFTIYQKPSARHFIDLYLILKKKQFAWDELSNLAHIKFDTVIDPLQLGSQLMQATEIMDLPRMLIELPDAEWRNYFLERAKELKKAVTTT